MKVKHFILIAILIVLPLTFAAISERFSENVRIFSFAVVKPILQISQSLTDTFQKSFLKLRELNQTYEENKRLTQALAVERQKSVSENEILQENQRLRRLLGFKKEVKREVVPAQIIARDISYWSRWIVLDKGTEDGVVPGMVLVNDQGLIGRVISVGSHISRAILIVDGESRVSVIVQTTRDTGLLEGQGDGPLVIKLLSLESRMKVGDAVITSGLGGSYPKGLPVGYIDSFEVDKDGLHLTAVVRSFVSFSKLEEVLCLNTTVLS